MIGVPATRAAMTVLRQDHIARGIGAYLNEAPRSRPNNPPTAHWPVPRTMDATVGVIATGGGALAVRQHSRYVQCSKRYSFATIDRWLIAAART